MATITQGVKALGALAGGGLATAYGVRPALWVAARRCHHDGAVDRFSPLRSTE